MGEQKRPLQPGDPAPEFTLPAANREGTISLNDLRGKPFLIGFFRGLHCPFCRRQVVQLASVQPALKAAGVETIAVVNTPVERARMYFRHRPTPATLAQRPRLRSRIGRSACRTSRSCPKAAASGRSGRIARAWPEFMAARVNPTGELDEPLQPIETNAVLNAKQGFEMEAADHAILATHLAQLVGHFLVDAQGKVAWSQIEARRWAEQHRHLSDAGRADRRRQRPAALTRSVSRGTAARPANRGRRRPSRRPRRRG